MTPLLVAAMLLTCVGAAAVVLVRSPRRQAIVLGIYGLILSVLFVLLGAPDVAMSQLGVGSVLVPLMVLLSLRTTAHTPTRSTSRAERAQPTDDEGRPG